MDHVPAAFLGVARSYDQLLIAASLGIYSALHPKGPIPYQPANQPSSWQTPLPYDETLG